MIRKNRTCVSTCYDVFNVFCLFFFQVFLFSDMNDSECKLAIFDVVLRHKMQLQGLIVETGKGYLAPNMPHRSRDCIPRNISCVVHSSQTKPNPSLGCGPRTPPNSPPISAISQTAYSYYDSRSRQIRRTSCPKEHIHQAKRPR